ncbi:leucine-rich repeat and calponin homology domain-containing protein 2-like isoform X6 [Ruditapes philippinarum]|uniref:leucine-rich repeat and calponin homology domain-containing protein 2-like isoform X6 n=1 Tax=Ruditapes philippinarum TaxID=129788 RepID=UPI00295AE998|nr:leucine-rich repeat and calponin homology domain-containing protein 2-like isoform X6 [Ruditapes philippinarum]
MASNFHGGGSQSPTSLSKPIERVFEDAQHTGEISLSCRKLREYPNLAAKYDLIDTISADVSKNRLSEVPKEVCTYISMEKLDCYHNVIKSIPEAIVQLQALTYLNLSRNQLSIIPSFISQLQALEVLIASHNRLVSLPEELGVLDKLMELDVSCNEISHLPLQIGDLKSLKSMNVRRNILQELPVEISKLNLRKLDISSNRVSKIPTVFRKIETLEDIILDNNPLTTPPAHVCTKGKQHIMKYLHIIAIREEKARMGMLGEVEMKRFRKSLPPTQSVSSEEFRNLMESPDKWKRHTVLSSDSGYSTTDSVDKCGWSPQEGTADPQHLIDSNNLAMRAAAAVCREQRIYTPGWEPRRDPPEPPQRINSRLSTEKPEKPSPPNTLTPGSSSSSTKSQFSTPPTPPTLYPSNPPTPLTPPTPQGPGPGKAGDAPTILGTSLEDEFTRELQRQKQEYENRKKVAEQLRIQQEEEEEREQRRRAAQRIQDEQQAMLNKQREEAEEMKRREEEHRLAEEARKAAEVEARKVEEARQIDEARRAEELRRQEEARQHKTDNKKPTVSASNSFKEERRPGEGNQPYRRTVSDSNQRLPATSHQNHGSPLTNGPIEEQISVNGTTSPHPTAGEALNTSFNSTKSTPPHGAPSVNGPTDDRPKTPQGSGVAKRTKPAERGQAPASRVSKPAVRTPGPATSSRSALPTSKRSNLNQDEELRKSNTSLKSGDTNKPKGDQRLRSIQKDAVNNYMNRRSSGSTSSEDDRKRSTPTRSLALQNPSSASSTSKRSGTGMSGTTRPTTTTTGAKRTNPTSRVTPTTSQTSSRRSRQNSTSSTTSVSSTTAKSSVDKSKRSGAVMTTAQVKLLDDYSKEANGPNYTLRRNQEHHKETIEQMEKLRKTISTRLKRTLPENLSEALSDGVLLCHLANQIRPRSVASVHVPSPAVPKLTPPKCRKNVENFLEACRKIGVPKDCLCACDDIVDWCRPASVALLVSELTRLSPLIARRDVLITYLCLAIFVATCYFLYLHGER